MILSQSSGRNKRSRHIRKRFCFRSCAGFCLPYSTPSALNTAGDHNLFHNFFKQGLIAVHNIINHISIADCLEMLSCTVNFRFFNEPKLHRRQGTFRLSDKLDMLDCTFIESNCPVRIIASDRGCDIEAIRQFHIDGNIHIGIKISRKIALVCGIIDNMVI